MCVASIVLCCVRLVGGASLQPPDEDGVGVQVMSEIYVFCLAAICSAAASPSPSRSLSLSPCDNKTKQNLRLDGSYDGGMGELGSSEVGEVGSALVVA